MDKYAFDYTLSPEIDDVIFNDACIKINKQFGYMKKQKGLVNIDSAFIQVFEDDNNVIVVFNDYDVGAVYVKSTVNLDELFPNMRTRE